MQKKSSMLVFLTTLFSLISFQVKAEPLFVKPVTWTETQFSVVVTKLIRLEPDLEKVKQVYDVLVKYFENNRIDFSIFFNFKNLQSLMNKEEKKFHLNYFALNNEAQKRIARQEWILKQKKILKQGTELGFIELIREQVGDLLPKSFLFTLEKENQLLVKGLWPIGIKRGDRTVNNRSHGDYQSSTHTVVGDGVESLFTNLQTLVHEMQHGIDFGSIYNVDHQLPNSAAYYSVYDLNVGINSDSIDVELNSYAESMSLNEVDARLPEVQIITNRIKNLFIFYHQHNDDQVLKSILEESMILNKHYKDILNFLAKASQDLLTVESKIANPGLVEIKVLDVEVIPESLQDTYEIEKTSYYYYLWKLFFKFPKQEYNKNNLQYFAFNLGSYHVIPSLDGTIFAKVKQEIALELKYFSALTLKIKKTSLDLERILDPASIDPHTFFSLLPKNLTQILSDAESITTLRTQPRTIEALCSCKQLLAGTCVKLLPAAQ